MSYQITFIKLPQIYLHSSTYINNNLYILGGFGAGGKFFYLDMSISFDTLDRLLWHNLTKNSIIPPHNDATLVRGGANNHSLFLFGGFSKNQKMALLYSYDTLNNSWSIPNIDDGIL